ncbi:hypothetical protein FBU30_009384 [Linnemannia zychae]|nr:hypothetical protein FBU30_009384 [Linnemannia zychae]
MRYQSLALLAMICSVVLAREDTAELCTGSLSCDEGYCCSRHGFCGRSSFHCSHTNGCNELKGTCGVVVLDNRDLPRVISYQELDQIPTEDLAKQLAEQGSHVSPDELKSGITIESIIQDGLIEKKNMIASSNNGSTRPDFSVLDVNPQVQPINSNSEPSGVLLAENDTDLTKNSASDIKNDARKLTAGVLTAVLGVIACLM